MNSIGKSIIELYEKGFSKKQIKRELRCSAQTICAYLNHEKNAVGHQVVKLRSLGLSMSKISQKLGISKSTVSRWCRTMENNDEISARNHKVNKSKTETKERKKSGRDNSKLKTSKSKYNNEIRRKRKQFIQSLGGSKCAICGFDKTPALCFHHKDPAMKSFGISNSKISRIKMETLIKEIEKCVLLCHNCHSLVEHGEIICDYDTIRCRVPIPKDLILENVAIKLDSESIRKEIEWINKRKRINAGKKEPVELDINFNRLKVREVKTCDINRMLLDYHYLGPTFKGNIFSLGLFCDEKLIGGSIITNPVRSSAIKNACEISRFVLSVRCKNLASYFLSKIIYFISKNSNYKNVVSFAENDTHLGTIYKAANFRSVGGSYKTYNYDGIHKKTIYERAKMYGLTEHEYAEKFNLNKIIENPKTKFVYKI